jgi:hypothetical protein
MRFLNRVRPAAAPGYYLGASPVFLPIRLPSSNDRAGRLIRAADIEVQ